jgi:NAD(P)-dependent dehydrogenase (short-subunit alcohol dehydrogenase family)
MTNLKTQRALITGGSKGIGLAIAQSMLNEGMQVAITGRDASTLEKARLDLGNPGEDQLLTFASDVRDSEGLNNVVKVIEKNWGGLDILIANAGIGHFAPIDKMSSEQWNETIDINLTGVFNSVKASVEALKSSKGYIISIASLAGTNFFANGAAYNASKFGLVGFTQAIMLDLRKYGVKVSTIMPGSVSTYFNDHTPSDADAWKIQPEDLGTMVIDLLKMPPRTLPSKIEVRPSVPPGS